MRIIYFSKKDIAEITELVNILQKIKKELENGTSESLPKQSVNDKKLQDIETKLDKINLSLDTLVQEVKKLRDKK